MSNFGICILRPFELKRKEHKVSMTVELDSDPDVLWHNSKPNTELISGAPKKMGLKLCGAVRST